MEKGPGFSQLLWDFCDGKPKVQQFPHRQAGAGRDSGVARDLEGARGARLQVLRADHRLRLHAGGRHGQRPSRHLPPPRGVQEARQANSCHERHAPVRPHQRRKSQDAEPRAWQRMLSGRRLDLLDPSPLDVEMEDIAHGLARVARWNGQTMGAHIFSVAQHCLLVETIARQRSRLDRQGRLAVLLHDAPEYVIGDMISPFKAVIGDNYKAVEARLLAAIHIRFGLTGGAVRRAARADQGRRPGRRLSRSDQARGLHRGGSAALLRQAAGAVRRHAARLPDAVARRNRRSALSRTVCTTVSRLTLSRHRSRAYIGAMIHVCSLALLHRTVEETGARHIVTLLRDVHLVTRPEQRCRRQAPGARHGRHPRAGRRLCRALRRARRKAHRLRARLGPVHAAGRALLCRHQPLDRGRVRDRLRAQSRTRGAADRAGVAAALPHRVAQPPHRVDRRPPARPQRPHGRRDRGHRAGAAAYEAIPFRLELE